MNLKPVFAAIIAVLTLTACGVETQPESVYEDSAEDSLTVVGPREPIIHAHPGQGVDLAAFPSRAVEPKTGINVRIQGAVTGAEGSKVHISVGLMACGYMEFGNAEAVLTSGQLDVTVPNIEQSYGGSLFVLVDNDHDGLCNVEAGDKVFEGNVALSGGDVSVNTSELTEAEGWSCFVFNSEF